MTSNYQPERSSTLAGSSALTGSSTLVRSSTQRRLPRLPRLSGKFQSMRIFVVLSAAFLCGCASQQSTSAGAPLAPLTIVEDSTVLVTPTGTIFGTLELPAVAPPVPVVLIIAGSGPTDRNGNSPALPGANNSLEMLADGLAQRGIASLRYDKRGIAGSRAAMTSESDLRFSNYVDDARDWIRQLRGDRRFSTITVAGHSEGSLIGILAASEAGADGFVSLEGAGRNAMDIIAAQLAVQLSPNVVDQAKSIMAKVASGQTPDSVPAFLAPLFRPSVQGYLASWFKYTPSVEIAKLSIPVLIIQGTTDIQTSEEDAKLLAAGLPGAKLVMIEGMNHLLKNAPPGRAEQMPTYSDPTVPVVPQLLDQLASFVTGISKK
jgi:alpha-beta hydrolase superfamily lysophospholipase